MVPNSERYPTGDRLPVPTPAVDGIAPVAGVGAVDGGADEQPIAMSASAVTEAARIRTVEIDIENPW